MSSALSASIEALIYLSECPLGFEEAAGRTDGLCDDRVNFLAKICFIVAMGPENQGNGEMEKCKVIRGCVLSLGPDEEGEVHCPDAKVPLGVRPNLLSIFHGRYGSETLWIISHSDVVPPGELKLRESDPFKLHVKSGFLFCRGAEDNGQAIAAGIFASKAVKETLGFGINVGLTIISDEESESLSGLDLALRGRSELLRTDDLILVHEAGNPDGASIEMAEKHLLHVKFRIKGQQDHWSRPDVGRKTLRATAHIIIELDAAPAEHFKEETAFFVPCASTFEATRKDANVPKVNSLPSEDVFYYDCRILPEVKVEEVADVMRNESPNATAPDSPVVVRSSRYPRDLWRPSQAGRSWRPNRSDVFQEKGRAPQPGSESYDAPCSRRKN